MPSLDVSAVRNEEVDPRAPAFAGGARRLVDANRRPPRAERLLTLAPGTAVSAAAHVAITVAGLMAWRAMVRDLTAPEPISVEVVHSIPGEAPPPVAAPKPEPPKPEPPKPEAPTPGGSEPGVAPNAGAKPPAPKRSVLDDALATPDMGSGAAAPATATAPPAGKPAAGGPVGPPPATGPTAASPRGPALVEPPPEPKTAATRPDRADRVTTSEAGTPLPEPPPPARAPPVPDVLSAPEGDAAVPAPPPEPEPAAKPATPVEAEPRADADPAAQLAAALPQQAPFPMPSTFRAMLSGQGRGADGRYKGAVFGMLGRGRAHEISEQAKRSGLKGQVVVRFTLDDTGAIDALSILQSSGKPAVDAAAEAMVRGAAPFPPPPPGGQRAFTPALSFGG